MTRAKSLYALAIHTSSPDLGLAIANLEENQQRSSIENLGRDLSRVLHSQLAEFLKPQTWQDLAWIAVAIGPGGFTGTRIGVVAARTLAQQLEIPLFGVSSLAAIATDQPGITAVQMPAQRGELYTALYQHGEDRVALLPDAVTTPEQWARTLEPYSIEHRIEAPVNQGQFVTEILAIARQRWQKGERPHWSEALPFYGQHSVESSSPAPRFP